jgi:hypothetical protein
MSAVILKLAEPLLKKYGDDSTRTEAIIALTIAAWNKSLLPEDEQDNVEKEIVDSVVPPDGEAELVGATIYMMEVIEERRKKLFPNLRKLIATYDLRVSDGSITLNVASTTIPAGR